jgi:hypothetical protein
VTLGACGDVIVNVSLTCDRRNKPYSMFSIIRTSVRAKPWSRLAATVAALHTLPDLPYAYNVNHPMPA